MTKSLCPAESAVPLPHPLSPWLCDWSLEIAASGHECIYVQVVVHIDLSSGHELGRTRTYGDLKVAKHGPTVQVSHVVQLVQAHATYICYNS